MKELIKRMVKEELLREEKSPRKIYYKIADAINSLEAMLPDPVIDKVTMAMRKELKKLEKHFDDIYDNKWD